MVLQMLPLTSCQFAPTVLDRNKFTNRSTVSVTDFLQCNRERPHQPVNTNTEHIPRWMPRSFIAC